MADSDGIINRRKEKISDIRGTIIGGMAKRGISREYLSKKICVPLSTMNDHLRHPENMRLGELWAILDVLGICEDNRNGLV